MKLKNKKEHKERKRGGGEIYGAIDRAVEDAHQKMINSNRYGY